MPLPAGAEAKGKESSVPGKLELLKVREQRLINIVNEPYFYISTTTFS